MPCPYSGKEWHSGIGAPSFDPFIVGRCTKDIDIPRILGCIYDARFLGMQEFARANYKRIKTNASACAACGQCGKKCTQHLKVIEEMRWAQKNLG
ncbi:MAG: hypothetical protein ABIF71_09915 [Planctomycetota bacterium]